MVSVDKISHEEMLDIALEQGKSIVADASCTCLVARKGGVNLATMVLFMDNDTLVISHLYVHPSHRQNGLGSILVLSAAAVGWTLAGTATKMSVFVVIEDLDAARFWLLKGFLPDADLHPEMHKQFERVSRRVRDMDQKQWTDWLATHPHRSCMRTLVMLP
jgi:GNAT superfamily N-acetyltransferase